jgi:lipopolysaccharide transport system ATP-binding protein
MCSEPVITARQLSKCYRIYDTPRDRLWQMLRGGSKRHYREFWATRDVSLEIRKGETVGIIGRNGSGKSTLLQLICGIATPTSGHVETQGRVAALLELGSGFNPEFSGRENVYMNGAILGLSRAEIDARFEEIAGFAAIGDFIDQPTKTYSSGMVVRLAFAVSVCVEPDVLIVDEALSVGDASFQFKCLNRLAALTERGTTLLFVSHDMSMVKRFCNRVIYLKQGEIRASGAPEEMAELYLLDMRNEQRQQAGENPTPVSAKPFAGEKTAGIAFGTSEGRITGACFGDTRNQYSSYVHGDDITVHIRCEFLDSVTRPNLSLTLQEARLLVISGRNFPLQRPPEGKGMLEAAITLRLPARLAPGRYHITLKLMDGETEESSQLIEKQVAILAFDMLPGKADFLGIVDMGWEETGQGAMPPVVQAGAQTVSSTTSAQEFQEPS